MIMAYEICNLLVSIFIMFFWKIVENEEPPTPRYNSSILADMLIEQNCDYVRQVITDVNSVKDAIILLQIWTKHRQLDTVCFVCSS